MRASPVNHQASLASPASHKVRVLQLEALQERQIFNENQLEKALGDASRNLKKLQDSNARAVEKAEEQLEELTVQLQYSLRTRHEFEERASRAEQEAAELAAARASLEWESSQAMTELDDSFTIHRQWELLGDELISEEAAAAQTQQEVRELSGYLAWTADLEAREGRARAMRMARQRREAMAVLHESSQRYSKQRATPGKLGGRHRSLKCSRALEQWHCYRRARKQRRQLWSAAVRAVCASIICAWALLTSRSRAQEWSAVPCLPRADQQWRRRHLCSMFKLWALTARALVAAEAAPTYRIIKAAVFHCWAEQGVSRLKRWACLRHMRWSGWRLWLHILLAWSSAARCSARRARAALAVRRRRARRHTLRALLCWSLRDSGLQGPGLSGRDFRTLRGCWRAWREHFELLHGLRALAARVAKAMRYRHLCGSLEGFCSFLRTMRAARSLMRQVLLQHQLAIMTHLVLPAWTAVVFDRRLWKSLRSRMLQYQLRKRLLSWHGWTSHARMLRRHMQTDGQQRLRCRASNQRKFLGTWAQSTRSRQLRRVRFGMISRRQSRVLCRAILGEWRRALREAMRNRRVHLVAARGRELDFGEMQLADQSHELPPGSAAMSLQLSAMDELFCAVRQAATVSLERQEASDACAAVGHHLAMEREVSQELLEEFAALQMQRQSLDDRWQNRRAALEFELDRALLEPASLRAAHRQIERQAAEAREQASAARAEATHLHAEMGELRRESTTYLRVGNAEVAELQARLESERGYASKLGEELRCRQEALHSHELTVETKRREAALRELDLLSRV